MLNFCKYFLTHDFYIMSIIFIIFAATNLIIHLKLNIMKQIFLVTSVSKFFDGQILKSYVCCFESYDSAVEFCAKHFINVPRGSGGFLCVTYYVVQPLCLF